jgi:hypothetical protein
MSEFADYRAAVAANRAWFNQHHAAVVESCDLLNRGFIALGEVLRLGRDADGHSHISLAPLLLILHRQAFVALDTLASRQAYQAWLLVRPGVESGLIIGKWLDNVENFAIWTNRKKEPQRYAKEYSGTKLRSNSLPQSAALQIALKTINDLFAHPNPDYYGRHTETKPLKDGQILLEVQFFDSEQFHWASVLGMLHLLIAIQDSLARAFANRFINVNHDPDMYGLSGFQSTHLDDARKAAEVDYRLAPIIYDIGLWRSPKT